MLTTSWLITLITFPNYFCWTITLSEFSGSQIKPSKFLDQPLSPVLSPCPPFEFHPLSPLHTLHKHHASFPFWEYLLGCCKGKRRDVKRKQRPPKQLMCHILFWSRHQKPKILLSETFNNRVFSISSLQDRIFEAQWNLKTQWSMVKHFLWFSAQRNRCQTGLTEVAVACPVVDQAHGDVPASSSPHSGVAWLLTLQVVPVDVWVTLLHNSHSKVGCFQKIK